MGKVITLFKWHGRLSKTQTYGFYCTLLAFQLALINLAVNDANTGLAGWIQSAYSLFVVPSGCEDVAIKAVCVLF